MGNNKRLKLRLFLIAAALGAIGIAAEPGWGAAPELEAAPRFKETYGRLPLHFIANQGQADPQVKFYVQGQGYSLFFTNQEFWLVGRIGGRGNAGSFQAVRIKPLESFQSSPQPEDLLPGKIHYLVGNDPRKWQRNVPTCAAVRYREVFPGIDLKFYSPGARLEYDLIVQPGADPSRARFQVDGVAGLEVTPEGDLAMRLPGGQAIIQHKPVIYQEIAGRRVAREGKFKVLKDENCAYGFQLAAYDPQRPLVIDPAISYSTFLGGGGNDQGVAIAVDAGGNAYVTGQTFSTFFPVTHSRQIIFFPEAFVTKINAAGNALVYSTFLGGSGSDAPTGIAVDGTGSAYVTGYTDSLNFPTKNAFRLNKNPGIDSFVAKLDPSGANLVFSTYLGGSRDDRASGIAITATGQATITGATNSTDYPVRNAAQALNLGSTTAFVTRLHASGSSLVFSTYLGGSKDDSGNALAVDAGGNTYVTGATSSLNFPVKNAFQGINFGTQIAFVSKLGPTGLLIYSTYLGGNNVDAGRSIAVDAAGQAFVTGDTTSLNFPLKTPFQGFKRGGQDGFVTKLAAGGNALIYSTFLGGSGSDQGLGIKVDAGGLAVVVGATSSFDFPVKNAVQGTFRGATDAFVTRLRANGQSLAYSTFLGGNNSDQAAGVALLGSTAFVTGTTNSANFPVRNAFQPSLRGGTDVFVTRITP